MSQISAHLGRGAFPAARLAAMAAAVSVVSVLAVVAAGGALSVAPRSGAPEESPLARTRCAAEMRGAFVFSFGLEQGSRSSSGCRAESPGG